LLGASVSFAQTSPTAVCWHTIVGVITAQNVNNPIRYGLAAAQCIRLPERRITSRALATGLKVTFGLFYRSSAMKI